MRNGWDMAQGMAGTLGTGEVDTSADAKRKNQDTIAALKHFSAQILRMVDGKITKIQLSNFSCQILLPTMLEIRHIKSSITQLDLRERCA